MNKPNLLKMARDAQKKMDKYSPQILTGIGIAGMITTTVLAVKATPKALILIDDKKKELESDELTPVDTVKTVWKYYIPALITGTMSTVCLIGANSIGTRRIAALSTAYKISETALNEYKDAVLESVGEEKVKEIKEKVAEKKVSKNPVVQSQVVFTGNGDVLCYDSLSGRYFKSSVEKIRKAQNDINELLINEMYASLNDFYDCIGLEHTSLGRDLGWNIDSTRSLQIDFDTTLTDEKAEYQGINSGIPCVVLNYNVGPKYEFDKMCY